MVALFDQFAAQLAHATGMLRRDVEHGDVDARRLALETIRNHIRGGVGRDHDLIAAMCRARNADLDEAVRDAADAALAYVEPVYLASMFRSSATDDFKLAALQQLALLSKDQLDAIGFEAKAFTPEIADAITRLGTLCAEDGAETIVAASCAVVARSQCSPEGLAEHAHFLIMTLLSHDARVRKAGLDVIFRLPAVALARHSDAILHVLDQDEDASTRTAAAKALGKLGALTPAESIALPPSALPRSTAILIGSLEDADNHVRDAAMAALSKLVTGAKFVVVSHGASSYADSARAIGGGGGGTRRLGKIQQQQPGQQRSVQGEVLSAVEEQHPLLGRLLQHESRDVRLRATQLLGVLPAIMIAQHADVLIRLAKLDADSAIRHEATVIVERPEVDAAIMDRIGQLEEKIVQKLEAETNRRPPTDAPVTTTAISYTLRTAATGSHEQPSPSSSQPLPASSSTLRVNRTALHQSYRAAAIQSPFTITQLEAISQRWAGSTPDQGGGGGASAAPKLTTWTSSSPPAAADKQRTRAAMPPIVETLAADPALEA